MVHGCSSVPKWLAIGSDPWPNVNQRPLLWGKLGVSFRKEEAQAGHTSKLATVSSMIRWVPLFWRSVSASIGPSIPKSQFHQPPARSTPQAPGLQMKARPVDAAASLTQLVGDSKARLCSNSALHMVHQNLHRLHQTRQLLWTNYRQITGDAGVPADAATANSPQPLALATPVASSGWHMKAQAALWPAASSARTSQIWQHPRLNRDPYMKNTGALPCKWCFPFMLLEKAVFRMDKVYLLRSPADAAQNVSRGVVAPEPNVWFCGQHKESLSAECPVLTFRNRGGGGIRGVGIL